MNSDKPNGRGTDSTGVVAEPPARTAAHHSLPTTLIPAWLPVALVLVAIPLLRPSILGEQQSLVGFALMAAAAAAALLLRRGEGRFAVRLQPARVSPAALLITCLSLGYLYVLLREAATSPGSETTATLQGIILTIGSLMALQIVCKSPMAGKAIARGFVIMIAVLCTSYAVTAMIWIGTGVGSGQVGVFQVGAWGPQPLFFPFTTTAGFQPVFGITVQRFTGLGREPGWMSMYCAAAYFLADMLGMRSRRLKAVLLLGLLGCVSTAGFGVFVVTWAYHRFLRDRGGISMANYLRQIGGLVAMAVALWLAISAPVVGLAAKSTQNAESLDDRSIGVTAGIDLLFTDPWGGHPEIPGSGINLIADIAVSGLPFVVLVCVGLLLTVTRPGTTRYGNAIAVVVLLTLLTSQPPKDSTFAFALVVLACALRRQVLAAVPSHVRGTTKESP